MELVDEIRNKIMAEAQKYIQNHKKIENIDKPKSKHRVYDIYAGRSDGRKSGDWFNIDDLLH